MGDFGGGTQGVGYTLTRSDNLNTTGVLANTGNTLSVDVVFGFSGAMLALSGGATGATIIVEGQGFDTGFLWRPIPYFRMDHGVWLQGEERLLGLTALEFWVPGPMLKLRVRRTAGPANDTLNAGWLAMHVTPTLVEAPGKQDFQAMVDYQTPGNNVATLFQFNTLMSETNPNSAGTPPGFGPRTWVTNNTSYTIPAGKRLRIHSWQGAYLAGAGGGSCRVTLRSNLVAATNTLSPPLGMWAFGPSAGGVNPDERWSGFAAPLPHPIDIYNPGTNASFGIVGQGTAGTTGKLTFTLFGYLVGN